MDPGAGRGKVMLLLPARQNNGDAPSDKKESQNANVTKFFLCFSFILSVCLSFCLLSVCLSFCLSLALFVFFFFLAFWHCKIYYTD